MAEDYTARATCECYYKFETLGADEQGQITLTNSGVAQSATIPSTAATYCGCSATKSGDFEQGDPDYMYADHTDSSEVDDLTAMTWVAWVNYESDPEGGDNMWLVLKGDGWAEGFGVRHTSDGLQHRFTGAAAYAPVPSFSTGKWYFFAATYDGSDVKIFWGDEETQVVELDSTAAASRTASTDAGFVLGKRWDAYNYLDGLMTEVAVFSEDLTLTELKEIQQYGMEGTVVELSIDVSECE